MKHKSSSNKIFIALYIVGFFGAGIIGLLSNSFFAYEAFNSLWAVVLYLFFLSILYISAYVRELLASRKVSDIVKNSFIFMGCYICFLLLFLLSQPFTLLAVIYSAAIMLLLFFDTVVRIKNDKNSKPDIKQFICAFSLILFAMVQLLGIEFINDMFLLWSLIPASIIFCAIAIAVSLMLYKKYRQLFDSKMIMIGQTVLCGIGVFAVAFMYSFTAVGTANCAFDHDEPTAVACVVTDMHIRSGAKTLTQFEIKVDINGGEKWISVPVTEYHYISAQDTVIIDRYSGAFGFAYLIYRERVDD